MSDSFAHGFVEMCASVLDAFQFPLLLFGVLFLILLFLSLACDVCSIEETQFESSEDQLFVEDSEQQEFEGKYN